MSTRLYLNSRSRGKISPKSPEMKMEPILFVSQRSRVLKPCLRLNLFKAAQLDLFDRQLPLDFSKKPSTPHSTNDSGEEILHQSGGVTVVRKRPAEGEREKNHPDQAAQARQSAKGGWQPVMGSKHAGAQKKRQGSKWVYRYPDGSGGWSAAPPKEKKKVESKLEAKESAEKKKRADKEEKAAYKDVGEKIGGARKDLYAEMAELAQMSTEELEKNPADAYQRVTKRSVFGTWTPENAELDKESGVDPAASWWKRQLFNSISNRPPDEREMRDAYRQAANVLKDSFSRIKTHDDVYAFMQEWHDALKGEKWTKVSPEDPLHSVVKQKEAGFGTPAFLDYLNSGGNEKLKDANIARTKVDSDGNVFIMKEGDEADTKSLYFNMTRALGRNFASTINIGVKTRKHWSGRVTMTMRSTKIVPFMEATKPEHHYTIRFSEKKYQEALIGVGKEVLTAEDRWAWAGEAPKKKTKEDTKTKRVTDEKGTELVFQRKLGVVERKGLPEVKKGIGGEDVMKDAGLRAVEYGNWVTDDERQWHTEMAYASFHDLAGLLGIPVEHMGINGRLGLAFGARGTGSAGWRKQAAAAHYEPKKRVINLTKIKGNGTLAHEWAHFLDHAITMAYNPDQGKPVLLSDKLDGERNVPPEIRDAMRSVLKSIKEIPEHQQEERKKQRAELYSQIQKLDEEMRNTPQEVKQAYRSGWRRHLLSASPQEVVADNPPPGGWEERDKVPVTPPPALPEGVTKSDVEAYHNRYTTRNNAAQEWHRLKDNQSRFYKEAQVFGAYTASDREMFARAFESYVESKLHANGQRSSYLVDGTLGGFPGHYIPHGDPHRERVNAAMDKLFDKLRANKQFTKSLMLDDLPNREALKGLVVELRAG